MRKFLALLLTLAMVMQVVALPVAGAEGVTTPSDITLDCEACNSDPGSIVLTWVIDRDGQHVLRCAHGVTIAKSKHEGNIDAGKIYRHDERAHYYGCTYPGCECEIKEHHVGKCTSFHTCIVCGASDNIVNYDWMHNYPDGKYEYDDTDHWKTCLDCGETVKQWHRAVCTNPKVCADCGIEMTPNMPGTQAGVMHNYTYEHNQKSHWFGCDDCGDKVYSDYWGGEHFSSCVNPGVCYECGATDVLFTDYVHHRFPLQSKYECDDRYHWVTCLDCGMKENVEEHYELCVSKPGECVVCGASGSNVEIKKGEHIYDGTTIGFDDQYHWYVCDGCGEKVDTTEHRKTCQTPAGRCSQCGATGVEPTYFDHEDGFFIILADGQYHWNYCQSCDEKYNIGAHIPSKKDPSICEVCGEKIIATPTVAPTTAPTVQPTILPTVEPTAQPTEQPIVQPTVAPTIQPTKAPIPLPTIVPTAQPTAQPTAKPTAQPTAQPTAKPTAQPTAQPTVKPTAQPTVQPTAQPTAKPTSNPTVQPTAKPTAQPTAKPVPVQVENKKETELTFKNSSETASLVIGASEDDEPKYLDVQEGTVRYVSQIPGANSVGYVDDYWTNVDNPDEKCNRAVFSMAWSYLGIDCTPSEMQQIWENSSIQGDIIPVVRQELGLERVQYDVRPMGSPKAKPKYHMDSLTELYDKYVQSYENGEYDFAPIAMFFHWKNAPSSEKTHWVLIIGRDADDPNCWYVVDPGYRPIHKIKIDPDTMTFDSVSEEGKKALTTNSYGKYAGDILTFSQQYKK